MNILMWILLGIGLALVVGGLIAATKTTGFIVPALIFVGLIVLILDVIIWTGSLFLEVDDDLGFFKSGD